MRATDPFKWLSAANGQCMQVFQGEDDWSVKNIPVGEFVIDNIQKGKAGSVMFSVKVCPHNNSDCMPMRPSMLCPFMCRLPCRVVLSM